MPVSYTHLLQVLLEPVSYLAKQMVTGIATRNAVITVRVPQGLEVLVDVYKRQRLDNGISESGYFLLPTPTVTNSF